MVFGWRDHQFTEKRTAKKLLLLQTAATAVPVCKVNAAFSVVGFVEKTLITLV